MFDSLSSEQLSFQSKILDLIGESVIVTDSSGKVIFWNLGAQKIFGWHSSEVVGCSIFDITVSQVSKEDAQQIMAQLGKGESWQGEYRVKRKDGSEFYAFVHDTPILNKDGNLVGIVVVSTDITERKRIEQTLKGNELELQTILDSSPIWIFYKDLSNHFIRVNKALASVLGLSKEQLKGRSLFEVYPKEEAEAYWEDDKKVIASGKPRIGVVEPMHSPRGVRWVQTDKIPYRDNQGNAIGIIGFSQDITERKKAEEELASRTIQLEKAKQKLEENAVHLEEYANQMEQLAEQRLKELRAADRLVAIGQTAGMVGHDIRNPLQAIASDLYLIEQAIVTKPNCNTEDIAESLSSIDDNINYINKIVSDLQDYTKPTKPMLAVINLRELITKVLGGRKIPPEINMQVNVAGDFSIRTDETFIKRIIGNLVGNAIQAMPNGGDLIIKGYQEGGNAVIVIQDTGVGIAAIDKPNLFKPLFTTKAKGQGLGLAVVKRFVEALNGTITFESEEGKGTKFRIELPIAQ